MHAPSVRRASYMIWEKRRGIATPPRLSFYGAVIFRFSYLFKKRLLNISIEFIVCDFSRVFLLLSRVFLSGPVYNYIPTYIGFS